MGFFKRTNKQFEYKARYYDGNENPYKIKYQLDQFRTTVGKKKNLKGKITSAIDELKGKENSVEYKDEIYSYTGEKSNTNNIITLIIIIFLLLFLFFIEFDLSIFLSED